MKRYKKSNFSRCFQQLRKYLLLLMDKKPGERCPFSRPFNKGRKAVIGCIFFVYNLSSFVERLAERTGLLAINNGKYFLNC
jgi:hypothetical protein